MDDRHWRFLAAIPYAAFVAFAATVLVVPLPGDTSVLLVLAVSLALGTAVAAWLVYGGGYDRLGWSGPGRDDLLELLVEVPIAAAFGWLAQALYPGPTPEPWIPIVPVLLGLIAGRALYRRVVRPRVGEVPAGGD